MSPFDLYFRFYAGGVETETLPSRQGNSFIYRLSSIDGAQQYKGSEMLKELNL